MTNVSALKFALELWNLRTSSFQLKRNAARVPRNCSFTKIHLEIRARDESTSITEWEMRLRKTKRIHTIAEYRATMCSYIVHAFLPIFLF